MPQTLMLIAMLVSALAVAAPRAIAAASDTDLPIVYLTWTGDPLTSIDVHWIGEPTDTNSTVAIRPDGGDAWRTVAGGHRPMPGLDLLIHHVAVGGLEPDTTYEFRIGGASTVYRFATMHEPAEGPTRFAVGGDVYRKARLLTMIFEQVAARDVDFVILGGDITPARGQLDQADTWLRFLSIYQQTMVRPDGRFVPLVALIGDHEVNGGFDQTPAEAPFFYSLFAYPGDAGRGVIDFGRTLSLVTLDSGHTHAVDGEQRDWLERTLAERADRTHLFAAYHVNAWSAERPMGLNSAERLRDHWVPLFEAHGVDGVFEHHEHCFKRTHPIRDNRIDATGVVYFGNGGVSETRSRHPDPPGSWLSGGRWFLARSGSLNHMYVVTLAGPHRTFEAVDVTGRTFDTYRTVAGAPAPIVYDTARPTLVNLWLPMLLAATAGAVVTLVTLAVIRRRARLRFVPGRG